jgi:hypothetical protein
VVAPGPPLGRVLDAGGGAEEDERRHQVRTGQGQVQGQPGPHRVADVGGGAAGVAERSRTLDHVDGAGGGTAVSGRVDPHHLVVARQLVGQRPPRPAGLGEAVHQDESTPTTVDLGVEHGTIVAPWT